MAPPPDKSSVHVLVWLGLALALAVAGRLVYLKVTEPKPLVEPVPAATPAPVRAASASKPAAATVSSPVERPTDPLTAFGRILENKAIEGRHADFTAMLANMAPAEAPAVFDLLIKAQQAGKDVAFERAALERQWGALAPTEALAFLDNLKSDAQRREGYDNVFKGWAKVDPKAAKDWLAANPSHAEYEPAFLGYVTGRAVVSRNDATATVLNTLKADDPLLPEAMFRLASVARDDNTNAMKAWFNNLPMNKEDAAAYKALAARAVYRLLPEQEYGAVGKWVADMAKEPWRNNGVIANFALRFANAQPKNAMDWVQYNPPTADKGIIIGVGEVVSTWRRKNLGNLEQWLTENPQSPAFQQAAHDLAIMLADSDHARAEFWGAKVNHPVWKPQVLKALAKTGH